MQGIVRKPDLPSIANLAVFVGTPLQLAQLQLPPAFLEPADVEPSIGRQADVDAVVAVTRDICWHGARP